MSVKHGDHLIWRNLDDNDIIDWDFNAAGQITSIGVIGNTSPNEVIAGVGGDFNHDGHTDLVLRDTIDGTVTFQELNNANGGFGYISGIPSSVHLLNEEGDYNGDGQNDLLWFSGGQIVDWTMSGPKPASINVVKDFGNVLWDVIDSSADYDGDGKSDLLVRDRDNGVTQVWTMNGSTIASSQEYHGIPITLSIVDGTGDFNGDGKSDIIWRNHSSGDVVEWTMNGTSLASVSTLATVPLNLQIVDAHGDYNGDGTSDILWRNTQTGEVVDWLMSNGNISSVHSLGVVPLSFTILDGHTDYSGDGTSDILFRDASNGHTVLWDMSKGSVSAVSDFGIIPTSISLQDTGGLGATISPDSVGFGTQSFFGTTGNNTFYIGNGGPTFTGGSGANVYVANGGGGGFVTDFKSNIDQFHIDITDFTAAEAANHNINFAGRLTPGYLSSDHILFNVPIQGPIVPTNDSTGVYIVERADTALFVVAHTQGGADIAASFMSFDPNGSHLVPVSAHDFLFT